MDDIRKKTRRFYFVGYCAFVAVVFLLPSFLAFLKMGEINLVAFYWPMALTIPFAFFSVLCLGYFGK